ncbi:MAG: hypothetical protein ACRYG7_13205 [Janthinobacterium lividum]
MTRLLIGLADFPDYVPFSVNIGAHLVEPHIRDAQTFDVWPLLPEALKTALAQPRPDPAQVAAADDLPADFPLDFDEDAPAAADWSADTITLFTEYLRPLLVLESARRMLLWHGLHITPAGAEIKVDQPISNQQRTELRADLAAKASQYRAKLEAALARAQPATSSNCGPRRSRPQHGGLRTSAI